MEQELEKQRYQMGSVLLRIIIVNQVQYHYPPLKDVQRDFFCQQMVVLGSIATTADNAPNKQAGDAVR
jgi:hypothetical protein